jgi:signal peptidase I
MVKHSGKNDARSHTLWQRCGVWYRVTKQYLDSPGILPWLLNILLAFLIIKFIVFPALSLIFGSALPVVAVMSGSMDHRADADDTICGRAVGEAYSGSLDAYWNMCGGWYEERGITFEQFAAFPLKRGFHKGDIMVILGPSRGMIAVGDTIVFQSREAYPIIHRVVAVTSTPEGMVYGTKGDHNSDQIVSYFAVDGRGFVSPCHKNGVPSSCSDGEQVRPTTPGAIAILDETQVPHEAVIGRAIVRIPWLGWIKIWFSDAINAIVR